MKKTVFLLFAAVAIAASAVSCSSGGDDDGYNFIGRWLANFTLATAAAPGFPPGGPDILLINQSGTSISVKFESIGNDLVMNGTCDPNAKTFSATGTGTGRAAGIRSDISGAGIDEDSMSGSWTLTYRGLFVKYNWTAELGSRNLSIVAVGGGTSTAADALAALSR